jgi:hypothetical protein
MMLSCRKQSLYLHQISIRVGFPIDNEFDFHTSRTYLDCVHTDISRYRFVNGRGFIDILQPVIRRLNHNIVLIK